MKKQGWFTLVELMVVMAIIAILATAGITQYSGFIKSARDTTRLTDLKAIETIVIAEMTSTGIAPDNTEIKDKLEQKANKVFEDPSNSVTSCFDSDGAGTCQYEYAQCDGGNGYILRAQFEDESRVASYADDELSGAATNSPDHYEIGNCETDPAGNPAYVILEA